MEQINNHSPLPTNEAAKSFLRDQYKLVEISGLRINGVQWTDLLAEFSDQQNAQSQETISALTKRVKELHNALDGMMEIFVRKIDDDGEPTTLVLEMALIIEQAARALLTPKNNGE